jgi:hypothetical protein
MEKPMEVFQAGKAFIKGKSGSRENVVFLPGLPPASLNAVDLLFVETGLPFLAAFTGAFVFGWF